ncbi:SufB/SufD family protein [Megalodesulfovibrio gigas]|uniref:Putative ABC-type transport system involved in Fe-S cluster assembly, permease component n=1 Tax=Megalodesulfovibrio gigas (strain ATCC 19364 / DSM 1382 / NCIMB 9332 / VKM B-1759) TaxID=1121448 RepID=T2GF52_MEGG1|nr:SufD family Fe-S cluster assembly protein [Megalodesulfovibrio gigas]AGW15205.1 putative ABC-type transport system involved in Fe-S cluster assembly, permease component [Megalodesulfovibrio gigas DSM 1382 = ATCC 19364]
MPTPIDLKSFKFTGAEAAPIADLHTLSADDKHSLLMAGVDVDERMRSGSFVHMNHSNVHCKTNHKGVEILDIKAALEKYDGLPDYMWKLVDPEKDDFTRGARDNLHGGYFIRTEKGAKVTDPVQSCLFIKGNQVGQNVHNIIIVEEDSELHIITGCAVAHDAKGAAHMGISEFYIKKGGKLSFTMIHNWGEDTTVRPRSAGVVEEGGVFINNYILLKPVKDLQMYPKISLNGEGAVARFNSVVVTPPGSYVDAGSEVILNAPNTRTEIIARTLTTGGVIINRGRISGTHVPAKGHLECKGLILGGGMIHAIPELIADVDGVELSHEAAVGKIDQEEIEYLMARGMDEDEATSTIVRGFLNVDIQGLPPALQEVIEKTLADNEKDMF